MDHLCKWCLKRHRKPSGIEKQSLLGGVWSEMCMRCLRKHERIMRTNPWAGLVGDRTRPVSQSS